MTGHVRTDGFVEYSSTALPTVGMAFNRVIPNSYIKLSKVSTGSTFAVEAFFDEGAIMVLDSAHGPLTFDSEPWRD